MTSEELARLRELLAKATPGKLVMWGGSGWPRAWNVVANADVVWPVATEDTSTDAEPLAVFLSADDQRAYVALRNAAPELIEAAERCAEMQPAVDAFPDLLAEAVRTRDAATARAEAAEAACALALRWLGDPDDPTGTFEDIGDWYYRETGKLRPGKSEPLEMGGHDPEERRKHFAAWADKKGREVRAALIPPTDAEKK